MSERNENMDAIKEMFDDYENQKKQRNGGKKIDDILSKIFIPRNTKEYFRILPPKKGEKIIEKAYFHQVQVNSSTGKRWKKIYCLKNNGDKVVKLNDDGTPVLDQQGKKVYVQPRCPLCEKEEEILKKQDNSIKGIKKEEMTPQQKVIFEKNKEIFSESQKWSAKKFYIISGIDRLAEKHGKKFWRFKHNYRNNGVLDKLMPVLSDFVDNTGVNFTDPMKGADCSITVVDAYMPNGKTYKDVSAISMTNQKPLHSESTVIKQWLDDDITWRDVFKPASVPVISSEEYLDMIIKGTDPYWDDSNPQNKHWVFPGRPDLEQKAKDSFVPKDGVDRTAEIDEKIDLLNKKIGNLSYEDIGTYQDNHIDLTSSVGKNENLEMKKDQSFKSTNNIDNDNNEFEKPSTNYKNNDVDDNINDSSDFVDSDEDFDDLPF